NPGSADLRTGGRQGLRHRLEEGRTARGAVAAAAGGEADRAAAREERAAAVAGLGAHVGLDQAVDDVAVAVVHGGVQAGDRARVHLGGGAAAGDLHADRGLGGTGDGLRGAVVEVHLARVVHVGGVLDQAVVVAREAGRRVLADHVAGGVR